MAKPKKTAADPSQSLETSQPRTERTVAVPLTEAVAETKPATEQSLPPRLFKAVLRLEGQLLVEDKQLLFETSDDQTRFVVSSVPNGKAAVKLLLLEASERHGVLGFWPRSDGSLHLSALSSPEHYVPTGGGPEPNEMLLSGRVSACEADSFTVKVKRNYDPKANGLYFKKMLIIVSSPVPEGVKPGHWIDLRL